MTTEDTTASAALKDLNKYLDIVYGTTQGFVHLSTGIGPRVIGGKFRFQSFHAKVIKWPEDRPRLVRLITKTSGEGNEAYVCPYVLSGVNRAKGTSVVRELIHADVDGNLNMNKVAKLGAFVVASGTPNHGHVYVRLTRSVDAETHRNLCIGLKDYLGDADPKISDNDLLRPAGTKNQKAVAYGRGAATDVTFLVRPKKSRRRSPEDLLKFFSIKASPLSLAPVATSGTQIPKVRPARARLDEAIPGEAFEVDAFHLVTTAISQRSGDRSRDTMRVVGACASSGLSLAEARYAVNTRPDLKARLEERTDDDVASCFENASASRDSRVEIATNRQTPPSPIGLVPNQGVCMDTVKFSQTEVGVAERWLLHFGEDYRHRPGFGWYRWTGTLWELLSESAHRKTILSVLRSIAEVECDLMTGTDPVEISHRRKQLFSFAKSMETDHHVKSIARLCIDMDGIDPGDIWDADPYGINTPKGYFDFRAAQMKPHSREYYCTRITKGSGDVDASSPLLELVLAGFAKSDEGLPEALQSICALGVLGLTADTWAHIFGEKRTGKSTLCEALFTALGGNSSSSYAATLDPKVFEETKFGGGDGPSPSLHGLQGVRFLFVDELSRIRLAADLVKRISGGVTISTREPYGRKLVLWKPHFILVGTGNDRARIPDDDAGLAARLFAIRIGIESRVEKVDASVRHALINDPECVDAVLAFAMRRAIDLLANGKQSIGIGDLNEPRCVTEERNHYVAHMDPLAMWLENHVEVLQTPLKRSGQSPTENDLFESYVDFCSRRRHRAILGDRAFFERFDALGYAKTKRTLRQRLIREFGSSHTEVVRGRFYEGVRLLRDGKTSLPDDGRLPVEDPEDEEF